MLSGFRLLESNSVTLRAVDRGDDGVALQRDFQGVPFAGLERLGGRLRESVDRAGAPARAPLVHDLHLESVMDCVPGVGRSIGDPDIDAGVRVVVGSLVDDANHAVAKLLAGVPEQAHAPFGAEESIFDDELSRPDMFPPLEAAAVEERPPIRRRAGTQRRSGMRGSNGGEESHQGCEGYCS